MKIGIIGAGSIGKGLAQKLSRKGHQIFISNSRGPHTIDFADGKAIKAVELKKSVKDVDVVIISIPFGKVPDLPRNLFSDLDPDIPVIETMNYFKFRDGIIQETEDGKTHSVWVGEQLGRPVIKAFNNIGAHSFITRGLPTGTPGRIALTVSGDNENWKKIAMQLIDDTGFDAYDAGLIADSWRQHPGNPAYSTDLTVEELGPALARADREKATANIDILMERINEWGEDYMAVLLSGKYPDNFEDKNVTFYRSINGFPVK